MDHAITYTWTDHHQLASVKSLAGEFRYEYDVKNPALLTQMTSPVHRVETTREPKRDLIAEVKNLALKGGLTPRHEGTKDAVAAANPEAEINRQLAAAEPQSNPNSVASVPSVVNPIISSYQYENDPLDRRTRIHMSGAAFNRYSAPQTVDITYNDRSEVIGATYTELKEGDKIIQIHRNYGYQYDAIGNRQKATVETPEEKTETTYTANVLNQYTTIQEKKSIKRNPENPVNPVQNSANPVQKAQGKKNPENPVHPVQNNLENPVHDPDGNLLTDGRYRYHWDAENRLIAAVALNPAAPHRIEYGYDHRSRRVLRREYNATEGGALTGETAYLYDDWNVIAELSLDPKSSILDPKLMTWGRDLSGSLQGAGGVGGLLAISTGRTSAEGVEDRKLKPESYATTFPCYDANGNVTQLVDSGGEMVAQYEYDPFGKEIMMDGALAVVNPWRFSTKPKDMETGMLYYGYRYYDSKGGRWASRDPIGDAGGVNLYGFVGNEPTGWVDNLGLQQQAVSGNESLEIEGGNLEYNSNSRIANLSGPASVGMAGKPKFEYSGNLEIDTQAIAKVFCIVPNTTTIDIKSVGGGGSNRKCKRICGAMAKLDKKKLLKSLVEKELQKVMKNSGIANVRLCGENVDDNCETKTLIKGWGGSWSGTINVPRTGILRELGKELTNNQDKPYSQYCSCEVTVGDFSIRGMVK